VRGLGVAAQMASRAREIAQELGFTGLQLEARVELPATINFWRNLGYVEAERNGNRLTMLRMLPITEKLATAEEAHAFGEHLAARLGRGDLVILTGDLGAGKTTLTRGIGAGLGVRGVITSPTFVIARVLPSLGDGPDLVHVDAYRLGGTAELDDLDLDTDFDEAVTVVEWGEGLAESLSVDRLELRLKRGDAGDDVDVRTITLTPVGPRWRELDLGSVGSLTSG
jgi:tRNA threonylcarbamoyladenosine biosynthesis protein TsaE